MRTICGLTIILLSTNLAFAQEALPPRVRVGLYAFAGSSPTGFGGGMNMHGQRYTGGFYGAYGTYYHYSERLGAGVSFNATIQSHFSFIGKLGYSGTRGIHTEPFLYRADRYNFSSIDVWALGQYNTNSRGGVKFTAALGLTESSVVAASGSQNTVNELHWIGFGMILGPGIEVDLKQSGAIQTRLLYQFGLSRALSTTNYYYRMHSGDANFLLQVGYLFD